MSKLLLTIVTGGFTLLGIILFTSSQNVQENYLPAAIQQTQETQTPQLSPQQISPPKNLSKQTTPTPVIIYVTPTPTPLETSTPIPTLTPAPSFSPLLTNTLAPTFTPVPSPTPITNHIFYTSSHWKAKYYYCDTDNGWQNLSEKYLQVFNSEEELLQNYDRILYELCKD